MFTVNPKHKEESTNDLFSSIKFNDKILRASLERTLISFSYPIHFALISFSYPILLAVHFVLIINSFPPLTSFTKISTVYIVGILDRPMNVLCFEIYVL